MSDPDSTPGSGLGAGVLAIIAVIGGVILLMGVGALFLGYSRVSYSPHAVVAHHSSWGNTQGSGSDENGTYTFTSVGGGDEQWSLVWLDKSGNVAAAVFGFNVPPPINTVGEDSPDGGDLSAPGYRRLAVRLDLITDILIDADGSKLLQVVTLRGVRELKPTLTGEPLTAALTGIDSGNILSTLQQIADANEVAAILQSAPAP